MEKVGSGIRDKHLGSATLVATRGELISFGHGSIKAIKGITKLLTGVYPRVL
jgi:hypothetical protein